MPSQMMERITKLKPADIFELIVKRLIGVILLCMWFIVGLFFWIPILTRVSFVYSGALLSSVVSSTSMNNAIRAVKLGIQFYPKGFMLIKESLLNDFIEQENDKPLNTGIDLTILKTAFFIILEAAFAIFFWLITLGMFQIINFNFIDFIIELFSLIFNH